MPKYTMENGQGPRLTELTFQDDLNRLVQGQSVGCTDRPVFRCRHPGQDQMGQLVLGTTLLNDCSQMSETLFLFPREDKLNLERWGLF